MKYIIYYSNYCQHSKRILLALSREKTQNEIHYLCIDKRTTNAGKTYVVLENGKQVLLPSTITEVPAMLLLHQGNQVIVGENILKHLIPSRPLMQVAEPTAFSISEMSGLSDNYSYLDMTPEELSSKGDGGMRISHQFVSLDSVDKIETPPEDFEPNKVDSNQYDNFVSQRNTEVQDQITRI